MKVLSLLFAFALLAGAQEVLTNDSIVKMVKGGLSDDVIVTVIQKQPGKFSLTPEDLVKLKQQGVSEKILNAMLNKGSSPAGPARAATTTPPAAKPGPASAGSNNTFFITWRDPRENAFQVGVPQGWQITGGVVRASVAETHAVIRAQSSDGKIQVFYDDPDVHLRQVPDQLTQFAGLREGQTVQAAWGGPVLLARYETGTQFAQQYVRAKLCRQPMITDASDLRDATAQMNAVLRSYAAPAGVMALSNVGEVTFRCGSSEGYVLANTFYSRPAAGPGSTSWSVYQLGGYQVSDPQQSGLGYYVLNTLIETLKFNPQWEARVAREVQGVTASVKQMQNAMAQSIAKYGQRQAAAASAGGFNHPNSGQLPTDLRKKWAIEDASRQKYSDATMGQTWVHSSTGANVRVDNSSTNWWRDNSGNVVRGPESGGPPPGSQGQYEKLQPGWQ